jgi:hypothetical protein
MPPQYFLYFIIAVSLLCSRGLSKKNGGESGGKGCMYIKDWFNSNFPLCLIGLLREVPNTLGRYCPHLLPSVISQLTPMSTAILYCQLSRSGFVRSG